MRNSVPASGLCCQRFLSPTSRSALESSRRQDVERLELCSHISKGPIQEGAYRIRELVDQECSVRLEHSPGLVQNAFHQLRWKTGEGDTGNHVICRFNMQPVQNVTHMRRRSKMNMNAPVCRELLPEMTDKFGVCVDRYQDSVAAHVRKHVGGNI